MNKKFATLLMTLLMIGGCQLGSNGLCQYCNMTGLSFDGKTLRDVDMSGNYLFGVSFSETIFDNAILESGNLISSDIYHAKILDSDFNHANLHESFMQYTSIIGSNFEVSNFEHVYMDFGLIVDSAFKKSKVNGSVLTNSKIIDVKLNQAELRRVDFSGATLKRVDFTGSDLTGADFSNARLQDVNFDDANLEDVKFTDATIWFSTFNRFTAKNLSFKNSNLRGNIFSGYRDGNPINFEGAVLNGNQLRLDVLCAATNIDLEFSESDCPD
jgi:uncharacterized protein YjbI with pentapeptide repeats